MTSWCVGGAASARKPTRAMTTSHALLVCLLLALCTRGAEFANPCPRLSGQKAPPPATDSPSKSVQSPGDDICAPKSGLSLQCTSIRMCPTQSAPPTSFAAPLPRPSDNPASLSHTFTVGNIAIDVHACFSADGCATIHICPSDSKNGMKLEAVAGPESPPLESASSETSICSGCSLDTCSDDIQSPSQSELSDSVDLSSDSFTDEVPATSFSELSCECKSSEGHKSMPQIISKTRLSDTGSGDAPDFQTILKDYAFYDEVDPSILAYPNGKKKATTKSEDSGYSLKIDVDVAIGVEQKTTDDDEQFASGVVDEIFDRAVNEDEEFTQESEQDVNEDQIVSEPTDSDYALKIDVDVDIQLEQQVTDDGDDKFFSGVVDDIFEDAMNEDEECIRESQQDISEDQLVSNCNCHSDCGLGIDMEFKQPITDEDNDQFISGVVDDIFEDAMNEDKECSRESEQDMNEEMFMDQIAGNGIQTDQIPEEETGGENVNQILKEQMQAVAEVKNTVHDIGDKMENIYSKVSNIMDDEVLKDSSEKVNEIRESMNDLQRAMSELQLQEIKILQRISEICSFFQTILAKLWNKTGSDVTDSFVEIENLNPPDKTERVSRIPKGNSKDTDNFVELVTQNLKQILDTQIKAVDEAAAIVNDIGDKIQDIRQNVGDNMQGEVGNMFNSSSKVVSDIRENMKKIQNSMKQLEMQANKMQRSGDKNTKKSGKGEMKTEESSSAVNIDKNRERKNYPFLS